MIQCLLIADKAHRPLCEVKSTRLARVPIFLLNSSFLPTTPLHPCQPGTSEKSQNVNTGRMRRYAGRLMPEARIQRATVGGRLSFLVPNDLPIPSDTVHSIQNCKEHQTRMVRITTGVVERNVRADLRGLLLPCRGESLPDIINPKAEGELAPMPREATSRPGPTQTRNRMSPRRISCL